jgi:hypothetical protein
LICWLTVERIAELRGGVLEPITPAHGE